MSDILYILSISAASVFFFVFMAVMASKIYSHKDRTDNIRRLKAVTMVIAVCAVSASAAFYSARRNALHSFELYFTANAAETIGKISDVIDRNRPPNPIYRY
jgi:hypothetical protein